MKVLAEGFEEKSQIDLLNKYGRDLYQGYHYSRPLSVDAFIAFVKKPIGLSSPT